MLQVWPELQSSVVQPWHGPPLLTDKVVTLLQLLDADRKRCTTAENGAAEANGSDAAAVDAAAADKDVDGDWWACMVFVETKVKCKRSCCFCGYTSRLQDKICLAVDTLRLSHLHGLCKCAFAISCKSICS
jgi:hypothetical protein